MTIAVLQHTSQHFGPSTRGQLAFVSSVTAGSTIFYAVRYGDTGSTYTINDNLNPGNYAQDVVQELAVDGDTLIIGSYPNVTSGFTTVSFNTNVTSKIAACIAEVSGLLTSSILDKVNSGNSTGTAANSGNTPTTTTANEFVYSAVALDNNNAETITGTGSTNLLDTAADFSSTFQCLAHGYQIVSSTGAYAGTYGLTASEEWACAVATYKAPGGGSNTGITPSVGSDIVVGNTPTVVSGNVTRITPQTAERRIWTPERRIFLPTRRRRTA